MQQSNWRLLRQSTLTNSNLAHRDPLTGEMEMGIDQETEAMCEEEDIAISSSSEEEAC